MKDETSLKEKPSGHRVAYVAGFFDGEGCISISKSGKISIAIVNTSKRTLDLVLHVVGVGVIQDRKQRINKRQYVYRAYGDNCIAVIKLLLPFLVDKRSQALLLLEYRGLPGFIAEEGKKGRFHNPARNSYITKMGIALDARAALIKQPGEKHE